MKESIVPPPTAAETHLKNHRYWITVSKETQSKGLQRELKVEKWNNLRSPVYRLEEREVSTVSKMGEGFLGQELCGQKLEQTLSMRGVATDKHTL